MIAIHISIQEIPQRSVENAQISPREGFSQAATRLL